MMHKKNLFLIIIGFAWLPSAWAMNLLFRPYDTLLVGHTFPCNVGQLSVWAERGVRPAQGFNHDSDLVNVLSIWNENQNTLAMLDGFPITSPISQLGIALDAQDNGIRGHLKFDGKLHLDFGGVFGARWYFLPHAWFTIFLPVYKTRLTDVNWSDLTLMQNAADLRVKTLLTNTIASVAATLGDGLQLADWERTGLGDLNTLIEWLFNFPQERPLLKNVAVTGRCGFTWPTGLKADPDLLFAFPYGYDGAVGILFGGGLAVNLTQCLKLGIDVQLLHLFGNTRIRRIKTAVEQTDLLLLAKSEAYKDYGLTQRFNLFVELYQLIGGFSFLAGYQFLKHGQDLLQLNTCQYSNNIANTAVSLEEWIVHSVELNMHYDFMPIFNCRIQPQVSIFTRIPFSGKRAAAFTTVGVMVGIDF